MINRNGLFYYYLIKRMEYLEKCQHKLDLIFIEKYYNLLELYKNFP